MKHSLSWLAAPGLFAALALGACTYVDVTPAGEGVRVLTVADDVKSCKALGKIHSSTKDSVGFIARGERSVRDELVSLARNNAAEMGGDTIVPIGKIQDGKQTFEVYRCFKR